MRILVQLIVVLALAWSIAACVAPSSTSPVDSVPGGPASAMPTFPTPASSKPGKPTPTIEVPPPID